MVEQRLIAVIEIGAVGRDVPAWSKDRCGNLGNVFGQVIGIVIDQEGVDLVIIGEDAEAQIVLVNGFMILSAIKTVKTKLIVSILQN